MPQLIYVRPRRRGLNEAPLLVTFEATTYFDPTMETLSEETAPIEENRNSFHEN